MRAWQEFVELRTGDYVDLHVLERDLLLVVNKARVIAAFTPGAEDRSPKAARQVRTSTRPAVATDPATVAGIVRARIAQAMADQQCVAQKAPPSILPCPACLMNESELGGTWPCGHALPPLVTAGRPCRLRWRPW